VGAGPHQRADELVEEVGIEAGEHPSDGRLIRGRRAGDPEDPEGFDRLVGRPFTDRDERPRAADDRCQPHREDCRQVVAPTTARSRVRDGLEEIQQR
jgi:hypothetical protein